MVTPTGALPSIGLIPLCRTLDPDSSPPTNYSTPAFTDVEPGAKAVLFDYARRQSGSHGLTERS